MIKAGDCVIVRLADHVITGRVLAMDASSVRLQANVHGMDCTMTIESHLIEVTTIGGDIFKESENGNENQKVTH